MLLTDQPTKRQTNGYSFEFVYLEIRPFFFFSFLLLIPIFYKHGNHTAATLYVSGGSNEDSHKILRYNGRVDLKLSRSLEEETLSQYFEINF